MESQVDQIPAPEPESPTAVPAGAPNQRFRGAWATLRAALGSVLGLVPHVMHHVGILAGTALLVGVWGNLALYIVGLALSIPLLRRLRRRFGSLWAPAIGVAVFTSMFAISAFVVGPALTSGSPAGPSTVAPTDVNPSHAAHHR